MTVITEPHRVTGVTPNRVPDFQRRINAWRRDVAADRRLTAAQREFLREIAGRPWGGRAALRVWWTLDAAAAHYRVHRTTVQRWIRAAVTAGYLVVVVRGRKHRAQLYKLVRPAQTASQGCTDAAPSVEGTSVPGGSAPPSPAAVDPAPRRRRGDRPSRSRRDPKPRRDRELTAHALTGRYVQRRTDAGVWFEGTDDPKRVWRVLNRALKLGDDPQRLRVGVDMLAAEHCADAGQVRFVVSRRAVWRAYRRATNPRGQWW